MAEFKTLRPADLKAEEPVMAKSAYDLFFIHGLANGGWRVEYRTLKSNHPTIDYQDTQQLLEGLAKLLKD